MKKILIVSHAMEIGGAERALLGLLQSMDYSQYEVDLFLCRQQGELLPYIPKEVCILPQNKARYLAIPMKQLLKEKQFLILYGRLKSKLLSKLYIKMNKLDNENNVELTYSHKYTYKYIEEISKKEYDLAISFLTPHYLVANNVRCKKKIAWIHTDYDSIQVDVKTEYAMWKIYDHIISISNSCTTSFGKKFPNLTNKIVKIENILTKQMVMQQAKAFEVEEMMCKENESILLSIGRYSYAKNFDNIPDICRRIIKKGYQIKWYLIGYGPDEAIIKNKIKEAGMEQYVVMLGKKENPYPYIKTCDIYVQPSRYEGKAVTVKEAQLLEKPVIITRFKTSLDQVKEHIDGVIVEMDNEQCAQGIIQLIEDKEKQEKLVSYLKDNDSSNSDEIHKLYAIVGDDI